MHLSDSSPQSEEYQQGAIDLWKSLNWEQVLFRQTLESLPELEAQEKPPIGVESRLTLSGDLNPIKVALAQRLVLAKILWGGLVPHWNIWQLFQEERLGTGRSEVFRSPNLKACPSPPTPKHSPNPLQKGSRSLSSLFKSTPSSPVISPSKTSPQEVTLKKARTYTLPKETRQAPFDLKRVSVDEKRPSDEPPLKSAPKPDKKVPNDLGVPRTFEDKRAFFVRLTEGKKH